MKVLWPLLLKDLGYDGFYKDSEIALAYDRDIDVEELKESRQMNESVSFTNIWISPKGKVYNIGTTTHTEYAVKKLFPKIQGSDKVSYDPSSLEESYAVINFMVKRGWVRTFLLGVFRKEFGIFTDSDAEKDVGKIFDVIEEIILNRNLMKTDGYISIENRMGDYKTFSFENYKEIKRYL